MPNPLFPSSEVLILAILFSYDFYTMVVMFALTVALIIHALGITSVREALSPSN
jgi:hypothetical protein